MKYGATLKVPAPDRSGDSTVGARPNGPQKYIEFKLQTTLARIEKFNTNPIAPIYFENLNKIPVLSRRLNRSRVSK